MKMDWANLPYQHESWSKNIPSIMAPGEKVTWPQFIAEMVIYWRSKIIKDFPKIKMGKGWSGSIQKQVRELNQQATVLCNYFPDPVSEPLVIYAFKKYFKERRPLKIGRYRKNRVNKKGNIGITQDEKDIVLGLTAELKTVMETRESFNKVDPAPAKEQNPQEITFNTQTSVVAKRKNTLASLMEMEKQIKSQQVVQEDKDKVENG